MKLSKVFTAVVAGAALGLLGACSSEDGTVATGASASSSASSNVLSSESLAQAMGGSETPLGLGCGWIAASDPDKANIAFPDSEAKYWVAAAPVSPQTRLRIDGRYPDARYFSYNAYDAALRPTDAVADFELTPSDQGREGKLLLQIIQAFMHKQLVLARGVRICNLAGFVNVQGQHKPVMLGIAHGFKQRQVIA